MTAQDTPIKWLYAPNGTTEQGFGFDYITHDLDAMLEDAHRIMQQRSTTTLPGRNQHPGRRTLKLHIPSNTRPIPLFAEMVQQGRQWDVIIETY